MIPPPKHCWWCSCKVAPKPASIIHHPSPSFTVLHRPAPSLTVHHRPSPSNTVLHRPSPSSTAQHRPSPSRTVLHRPAPSSTVFHWTSPSSTVQQPMSDSGPPTLSLFVVLVSRNLPFAAMAAGYATTPPRQPGKRACDGGLPTSLTRHVLLGFRPLLRIVADAGCLLLGGWAGHCWLCHPGVVAGCFPLASPVPCFCIYGS